MIVQRAFLIDSKKFVKLTCCYSHSHRALKKGGGGLKKQGGPKSCESCGNYIYDEDYGYYVCEADLDEDEMASFLGNHRFECPYYQTDDEYRIVRKQM